MKFDVNFAKKSTSNNLPDQTENKMFPALNKIRTADIDNSSETLGRVDDQIVIFNHLELTEFLAFTGLIENTFIDGLESESYMRFVHLGQSH